MGIHVAFYPQSFRKVFWHLQQNVSLHSFFLSTWFVMPSCSQAVHISTVMCTREIYHKHSIQKQMATKWEHWNRKRYLNMIKSKNYAARISNSLYATNSTCILHHSYSKRPDFKCEKCCNKPHSVLFTNRLWVTATPSCSQKSYK